MLVGWQQWLNLPTYIPLHFVTVWQMAAERPSDKTAPDMEVHMEQRCGTEFLHAEKNGTHWHLLLLSECFWRPKSGCEHREVVGGAFQQWRQQWSPLLVQICMNAACRLFLRMHSFWWWLHWKTAFCSWEFAPSKIVNVHFVSQSKWSLFISLHKRFYLLGRDNQLEVQII